MSLTQKEKELLQNIARLAVSKDGKESVALRKEIEKELFGGLDMFENDNELRDRKGKKLDKKALLEE